MCQELYENKWGRFGMDLKHQVQEYIREVQASGDVINTPITLDAAKGIILTRDSNMLSKMEDT